MGCGVCSLSPSRWDLSKFNRFAFWKGTKVSGLSLFSQILTGWLMALTCCNCFSKLIRKALKVYKINPVFCEEIYCIFKPICDRGRMKPWYILRVWRWDRSWLKRHSFMKNWKTTRSAAFCATTIASFLSGNPAYAVSGEIGREHSIPTPMVN